MRWKARAVAAVTAATALTGPMAVAGVSAANASPAAVTPAAAGWGCKSGDSHLANRYVDKPDIGFAVYGNLCQDHVTTGWYWNLEVLDTKADGKCAHGAVTWMDQSPTNVVVEDYGMYVCGYNTHGYFYSQVRNWTHYNYTGIAGFVDGGQEYSPDLGPLNAGGG
jgi:hypothetical protein